MELPLLLIYSFFVWLIFIKFKWLPWNIVSQVIVATIPIVGMWANANQRNLSQQLKEAVSRQGTARGGA